MSRYTFRTAAIVVLMLVMLGAGWVMGRIGVGSRVERGSLSDMERQFSDRMKNVALVGFFTVDGRGEGPARPDRYEIASVDKIGPDTWRFMARMLHGAVTLPIVTTMVWAGDTPMITMTDVTIPTLGTFTARVFFHGDRYAGTWQHGHVGGQLWGRIEKLPGR